MGADPVYGSNGPLPRIRQLSRIIGRALALTATMQSRGKLRVCLSVSDRRPRESRSGYFLLFLLTADVGRAMRLTSKPVVHLELFKIVR